MVGRINLEDNQTRLELFNLGILRSEAMMVSDLPARTQTSYLAEGGANVVYRIAVPLPSSVTPPEVVVPDYPLASGGSVEESTKSTALQQQQQQMRFLRDIRFDGKLLRLRKSIDSGVPYHQTIRDFNRFVKPLFRPSELVDQVLVKLPKGFLSRCNEQLRLDEKTGRRPRRRNGVYLYEKEPYGLLITDMTVRPGSRELLWEFKPKWLLQSPSAPANAKRCRTCALREMKNHDARMAGEKEAYSFCPLDLVSDRFEDVLRATRFFKNGAGERRRRVATYLYRNPLLQKLQGYQRQMNSVGLRGIPARSGDISVPMTLRDCTVYVKVSHDESQPIETRLGDLDVKTGGGGKSQYWRDIETRLISEGWYSGTRKGQENSECSLQGTTRADVRA
ncbi:Inositol-pentakisphosphate 2-kinase [Arachnomyces sp. PD_36]|nr:Inositol-pentakisphosphate 2-kinase [Arachnomyces sp. PD_36]